MEIDNMKSKRVAWILGLDGKVAAYTSCLLAFVGFIGTFLSWYIQRDLIFLVFIPPLIAGSVLRPLWGVFVGAIGSCGLIVISDFYVPVWLSTLLGLISGLLSRVLRDQWASGLAGWLGSLLVPQPWYIPFPLEIIYIIPGDYVIWAVYPIAALISFVAVSIISISPIGIWLTKSRARLEYGVLFSEPTTKFLSSPSKEPSEKNLIKN
jgi:hypothetical protein